MTTRSSERASMMSLVQAGAPPQAGISLNTDVAFDLPTLIETRLLVQANSGGGKSWALRRILEQSHGRIQQMVIDVEGGFRSLRETYAYLLLGSEEASMDSPITPENAALVATKLLETQTSVILDLYEFLPSTRQLIVRRFLDALVDAPKHLWHDCLVVLDEAHIFCPERGGAEARSAVEALCSRGRARGLCAILATQRISKLGKDVVSECNNKLIGRASLDVDMKRSNTELEFSAKSQALKKLAPGEFYAFGPALSPDVQKIAIGPVVTTHPKAGSRRLVSSPPPPESLGKVLAALRALPGDPAEQEGEDGLEPRTAHALLRETERRDGDRLAQTSARSDDPGVDPLAHPQVAALLAVKEREIQQLRARLELLGRINVAVDGKVISARDLPALLHVETLTTQVAQASITLEAIRGPVPSQDDMETGAYAADAKEELQALREDRKRLRARLQAMQASLLAKEGELQRVREELHNRAAAPDVVAAFTEDQRLTWRLLIQALTALKKTQCELVRLLLTYDGHGMTVTEIAGRLRKATTTIHSNIPHHLLACGLIEWHKAGNALVYTARAQHYLHTHFPGKEKALLSHLFAIL